MTLECPAEDFKNFIETKLLTNISIISWSQKEATATQPYISKVTYLLLCTCNSVNN